MGAYPFNERIGRVAVFSGCDQIGDGLFKFPFLRSLRATFPNAEICWMTAGDSVYAGVLRECAAASLDRVVTGTGIGRSTLQAVRPRRMAALGPVDIAIDTQTVVMRSIAVRRSFRPLRFISATAAYALSDTRPSQIGLDLTSKPRHLIDHLMLLLRLAARGKAREDMTPPAIPERFLDLAAMLLPEGRSYVGFAPGSGDISKRWPLDRFIALARRVAEAGSVPVFFFGPDERDLLGATRRALPDALLPEEGLPPGTPRGPMLVSALGSRLNAALANDSGIGHMLALSGGPLVLLYGRHAPEKYAPRTPRLTTLWAETFGGPSHELIPLAAVEAALFEALGRAARAA